MDLTSCNQRMAAGAEDVDRISPMENASSQPRRVSNHRQTPARRSYSGARDEEMKDLQSHAAGILRHCLEMGTDDEIRGLLLPEEEE